MDRIVDLTQPLADGMRGVEIAPARVLARDGWNALTISLYSHAGTHADAPRHFFDGGSTVDAMDLAACIGPARVVDLTALAPREQITVEHLGDAAGAIGPGSRLVMHTGWSVRLGEADYRTHYPRISLALAEWLAERRVALVGLDTPSVADVNDRSELTAVHRALLAAGIVIVEDLTNLSALSREVVELIVLPLKVAGGDGAPARVVAIERDSEGGPG